jgi:carboxypeptidase D
LLIGNGWISPVDQYLAYLPFAYQSGLITAGSEGAQQVEHQQRKCVEALNDGGMDRVDTPICEAVMTTILEVTKDTKADTSACATILLVV